METKLYVGNLAYSTTEDEIRKLFAQAGVVKSVALITDRETGRSKGFAFVEMGSQSDAQKAISMFDGAELQERTLKVNIARPREERERSGGGGGFDRRGGGPRPGGDRSRGGGRGGDRQRRSW